MTHTKDEALKLALEALEGACTNPLADPEQAEIEDKAITAIKQALAAPVQQGGTCGKLLAPGQWWHFCGETDMGQTLPIKCTNCGGKYKLSAPEKDMP
jgi:hypothetical protein